MKSYKESIELLSSKGKFYIDLGLERTLRVLELLGNPQENLKCIQIAGTNGKGSVVAMLSSVLVAAGYKTGVYTSPHVFEYTERIKINNEEISEGDFAKYICDVVDVADSNEIHLTEFEILTVAMFKYFNDKNVDIVVLETGLGGRLDATNVISKNICSIITHIDLDHTDRLGDTKEKIAYEKAGIIKKGCPIITSEGYEVIKDKADEMDSMFVLVNPYVEPKYINQLSLKGVNQQENLALVLETVNLCFKEIDEGTIIKGLSNVEHICRFQYIKEKNLIVDAAHNPNSIDILNRNLDYYYPNTKRQFIFGCLKNKDYSRMLDIIFSFNEYEDNPPKIYFYNFSDNACTFEDLHDKCIYFSRELKSKDDITYSDDVLTIICGSIYMIQKLLGKEEIK